MRHVEYMGQMRNADKILVGKRERKRPLGRSRHRCEYDIRMDLIGRCGGNGLIWFRRGKSKGAL
jgi:hypothetical protein